MSRRVLVTDHPFPSLDIERSILEPLDVELVLAEDSSEDALVEAATGVDAILVCYAKITRRVIEAAAQGPCKVVSRYGGGFDNIDVEAATEHGILATYVPDYCLDEVADHAMALLMTMSRGVIDAARLVDGGDWGIPYEDIHRLSGRRLAVIGVGGIGRRVVDRARPFGYEMVGFDPFVKDWTLDIERAETFEEAVREADAITLHVPMSSENHHLINAESIAAMNRKPIVVNTARGGLIDLDAALAALEDGSLRGLAIDVTEEEPPAADHPVRAHPRVVLTPHIAYYSVEAQAELQTRAANEVVSAFNGDPPSRPLNPEVLTGS
jgi:D-3-phosphoglycerate dehydrogenase